MSRAVGQFLQQLRMSYRQYTLQSSNMYIAYITLTPLPVSSVYTHPQESYIKI
jgi:hypothetical protein